MSRKHGAQASFGGLLWAPSPFSLSITQYLSHESQFLWVPESGPKAGTIEHMVFEQLHAWEI